VLRKRRTDLPYTTLVDRLGFRRVASNLLFRGPLRNREAAAPIHRHAASEIMLAIRFPNYSNCEERMTRASVGGPLNGIGWSTCATVTNRSTLVGRRRATRGAS
jgi:hypothetical protein